MKIAGKDILIKSSIIFLLVFSLLIFILQLQHAFYDYYLGPYGDEWVFVESINKVSLGVDVLQELIKYEGDYRHIFTKLIWAGNYIFANGTNLFTSYLVVTFLFLYMLTLAYLLISDTTLKRYSKLIIFSVFLLANFGGYGDISINSTVFATWPIVLTGVFLGSYFLTRTVQVASIPQRHQLFKIICNLSLAHIFGAIALCTFGHGFLYFIFFAIVLWIYQASLKSIVIYCAPGAILTWLYMRNYHSVHNAISNLKLFDHFILNLPYYFFRLLADSSYFLFKSYWVTALLGLFGFILLGVLLWQLLIINRNVFAGLKNNALLSILTGMLIFSITGCILGVFARYYEIDFLFPLVPSRFAVLVDCFWASVCGVAIILLNHKKQFFLKVMIILSVSFLMLRQFQYHQFEYRTVFFPNIAQVEQAIGLHNGYLSELAIAQWSYMNSVEETERRRGIGGFAIKERLLLGLNINHDFKLLSSDKCLTADITSPTINSYDHLIDPAFSIYGKLSHGSKELFSKVILMTNSKNDIVGFGLTGNDNLSRFGKSLDTREYFAVAPWHNNETYRSYILTKDREHVCLLNNELILPKRDPLFLKNAIAPLQYSGKDNEYLLFLDFRMQVLPHFLGFYHANVNNFVTEYTAEAVPFDALITQKKSPQSSDGVAMTIPEKIADQIMGHRIKVKLLVKHHGNDQTSQSAIRYDVVGDSSELFKFTTTNTWQAVENVFTIPKHKKEQDYLRIFADINNKGNEIIFRAASIEILD